MNFKKQFYVFSFADYYPQGGLSDVKGTYDSLEEAKKAIEEGRNYEPNTLYVSTDNCYVWDSINKEVVFDLYKD